MLGGGGSDLIEGRGNDDIIDGDHALMSDQRAGDPMGRATRSASTDLMEDPALAGNFGPGSRRHDLQQAVFAHIVQPGQLVPVREILSPSNEPMGTTPRVSTVGDCPFASRINDDDPACLVGELRHRALHRRDR